MNLDFSSYLPGITSDTEALKQNKLIGKPLCTWKNRKCRTCFTKAAPVSNDLFIMDIHMDARKRIQDTCLAADLHEKAIWKPMKTI